MEHFFYHKHYPRYGLISTSKGRGRALTFVVAYTGSMFTPFYFIFEVQSQLHCAGYICISANNTIIIVNDNILNCSEVQSMCSKTETASLVV